jgi:hypothetical protein
MIAATAALPRAATAQDAQPTGWQHNPATGHYYEQVGPMTWAEAEAYAVSVGGHLVTINNQAEQDWLAVTFTDLILWIGMNDRAAEGSWVWSSGEPVTYTNWTVFEPNNCTSCGPPDGNGPLPQGEDAAVMNWTDPWDDIGWNDLADFIPRYAIVEVALANVLDGMVADGRLPNAGVANSILKQAEHAPLKALTNHLKGLVRGGRITQQTMDEILTIVAG